MNILGISTTPAATAASKPAAATPAGGTDFATLFARYMDGDKKPGTANTQAGMLTGAAGLRP